MLSRRHLRIKVFQTLYSNYKEDTYTIGSLEKNLNKSVDKIYELFIYHLSILVEIRSVALKNLEDKKNKKLPSKEDLNPNLKFVNNPILVALANNKELSKKVNELKVSFSEDQDLMRKLYKQVAESPFFAAYLKEESEEFDIHKSFIVKLFKHQLADNEIIEHLFEEKNIHWTDDNYFVCGYLIKFLKSLKSNFNEYSPLPETFKDPEDDKEFLKILFTYSFLEDDKYEEIVMTKAKNWESERIATVDMILMKMAVCELLKLPSIPVKVTLNEYIDISKEYSTPKSKLFINGVLDKIIPDLKKDGLLVKTGRGLIG